MTTTCAQWQAKLDAAEAARESLLMGGQVAEIRSGEKTVKYQSSNLGDLYRWIAYLQGKVDACNGVSRCRRFIRMTPSDSC